MARRPAQPDEELTRVIPNVALHGGRNCWRRRGRRAALSSSSPSATASPTTSPLPLPLAAGSATAGAGEGGTRCRAATLAATVEGQGFPLSMANRREEQKLKEKEDGRVRGAVPPLPLFIKGRGWGSTAPLGQSRRKRRREPGPTRRPNQRRLGFPPPPLATSNAWEARGERAGPKRRVRRPLPTP